MITALALLAITIAAGGSDDEVLKRNHVHIVANNLVVNLCNNESTGDAELGLTTFQFQYATTGLPHGAGATGYAGNVAFSLGEVVIYLPKAIVWKGTGHERGRTEELRRAILHHEVGHVRVAEAVRDELNARPPLTAPDYFAFGAAADARGHDGFDRFIHEERAYDDLTDHGRRQHTAPGVLSGTDTTVHCA